jgi:hypothetical protein
MSRQFSPYSTTRDSYSSGEFRSAHPTDPHADGTTGYRSDRASERARRRAARHGAGYGRVERDTPDTYAPDAYDSHDTYDSYADTSYDDDDTDYADYQFPADYHEPLDRRWIWVAGVAGVILMLAVICTGVILGGGDSGTVSAGATTSDTADAAAAADVPSASIAAPPAGMPALPAETVTTVTPTPSASAVPTPEPLPTAPAPIVVPEAPVADPALAARTITYQVTGNRQLIDLITVIYTDQQGALRTDVNVALPWVKTVTLDPGVALTSVTATSVGGQLNCSIIDGSGAALAVQGNNTMITTCTR